jgi:hypothetical protein
MDFTIHVYGYAYYMFNTLNSIAMLRNSSLYPAIINTVTIVIALYYALQISVSNTDYEWRTYIKKVLGIIVLINALLLPKTSMNIKDHVEKHFWQVDNIPLAFALPIGMVEEIGHLLTIGFEQAFSAVNGRSAFNYYHHGNVFGARLAKEVMQAKVRNPEFVANMNSFIKRCVVLPAMIGHQFTKEELVSTKDMWSLVSSRAGTFTRVPMIINGIRQDPSPTCKQAVPYFENIMNIVASGDITAMSIKLRAPGPGQYNPSHVKLNNALKGQISALYNSETSVESILKHNMMINSLNQYRAGSYAGVKAQLQHEAGGLISGDLADKILTGMQAVIKNMIYGSFIFVLPLMIFAGGMSKYRGWITTCLSLQLWPPLFAMLNMMIDIAYEPTQIVSYSGWSTTLMQIDHIASIAAGMTLIIPFLAIYVTRMGENGLMEVTGSLLSGAQGAGSAISAEKASGGMNYDNESIANRNRSNVSENKYDDTRQYVSGINSGINMDGSMERVLPNGQVITTGGAGNTSSLGEARYQETDSLLAAKHQGMRQESQALMSESSALSKVHESAVSNEASALTTFAENVKTDNGYSVDTSTDEGREVLKAMNRIDEMTKSNGYSWQQNAEAAIKADAGLRVGLPKFFGGLLSVDGGVNVSGGVTAVNSSSQEDTNASKAEQSYNTNEKQGSSTRTANNSAYLESKGIDKNQQDSFRKTYNEMQRLEHSINAHKDNIAAYSQMNEYVASHANEYSKDQTQDVINAYVKKYGVSDSEAGREVLSGSPKARALHSEMGGARANEILKQIKASRHNMQGADIVGSIQDHGIESLSRHDQQASGKFSDYTKDHSMSQQKQIGQQMAEQAGVLRHKHEAAQAVVGDNYNDTHDTNHGEYVKREQQIQKYEEDRIGRGGVGTLGGRINGVGRPEDDTIPKFDPIMRYVGEEEMIDSLDKYQPTKPALDNSGDKQAHEMIDKGKIKDKY